MRDISGEISVDKNISEQHASTPLLRLTTSVSQTEN